MRRRGEENGRHGQFRSPLRRCGDPAWHDDVLFERVARGVEAKPGVTPNKRPADGPRTNASRRPTNQHPRAGGARKGPSRACYSFAASLYNFLCGTAAILTAVMCFPLLRGGFRWLSPTICPVTTSILVRKARAPDGGRDIYSMLSTQYGDRHLAPIVEDGYLFCRVARLFLHHCQVLSMTEKHSTKKRRNNERC